MRHIIYSLIALALLIVISPVLLLCMLLILLIDGRPIFFTQERVGKNGKLFKCIKLRSMKTNSKQLIKEHLPTLNKEERIHWEETRKLKFDPRLTKTGKVLRKLSLDELPQLINIFCLHMSFVGPRAVPLDELNEKYGESKGIYTKVKPGLTGLAQLYAFGKEYIPYNRRIALDRKYIKNNSLMLDIYIIGRTFKILFAGSNY